MGPLSGVRVIEIKGIGPGPFAGMLLADMGAEVICVERARKSTGIGFPSSMDVNCRGKKSIALNLKHPEGLETLLNLVDTADMLLEGFRPGVAEKLGFGPDVCHRRNAKLVYGRITGWGQTGPLSQVAGHDINYISISGALAAIGTPHQPIPPLNLVGDYGGGSLYLVMGMLASLHAAQKTGQGDVVDAAITDGAASLMSVVHSSHAVGAWAPKRGVNLLDGAAHFYRVYETLDRKHVSIGPIEPQFYQLLIDKLDLDSEQFANQLDPRDWPNLSEKLELVFKQKTRDEWCDLLEGSDVCFAPVLDFTEAPMHPHNQARGTFIEINGVSQAAPAPRFSHNTTQTPSAPQKEGQDTEAVLTELGLTEQQISQLIDSGAIPS